MRRFESGRAPGTGVSIKLRATAGCFHREHSPQAYAIMDREYRGNSPELEVLEHESGPEILVYVAAGTATLAFVTAVVNLIVASLRARNEGIKKGDQPREPLELIVRRSLDHDRVREVTVLRIGHQDPIDPALIERLLVDSVQQLTDSKSSRLPPKDES